MGVKPPLSISCQHLDFSTPLFDSHRTSFFIQNDHLSADEFTHPVPRIGNEKVFPVGPTSFSIVTSSACPVVFSPQVGTIAPGKSCQVFVTYSPKITDEDVLQVWRKEFQNPVESRKSSRQSSRQGSSRQSSRAKSPPEPKSTPLFWQIRERLMRQYQSAGFEVLLKYCRLLKATPIVIPSS